MDPIMNRFISNLPSSFPVAGGEVRLRGALVQIDETTGRAVEITRVDEPGPSSSGASEPEPKTDIENAPSPEQT
jgi:calcineurin-like phosphoesterase